MPLIGLTALYRRVPSAIRTVPFYIFDSQIGGIPSKDLASDAGGSLSLTRRGSALPESLPGEVLALVMVLHSRGRLKANNIGRISCIGFLCNRHPPFPNVHFT